MRYSRKLFGYNSKKARQILIDRAGGVLIDAYNGCILDSVSDFDAEHIVQLYDAWHDGFKQQYQIDPSATILLMNKFAHDPRNLVMVGKSSNRSRGHKTLWNWLPLNLAYIPIRNAVVREIYADSDYNLKMSKPKTWALDWSDKKLAKHKHGIHMGKVRAWLISHGFHRFLMPF